MFMPVAKLNVFNTLSRSKEELIPFENNTLHMFVCGQTVYDDAHIGHAKTYVAFAVIARWLRHLGYKLTYAQNITDVEDKIIARANEQGISAKELAEKYTQRFFEDMQALNIKKDVDVWPKSSEYIDAIRNQIQLLVSMGYAYLLGGSVYYDVAKFADYTKLSGMNIDELNKHRIEPEEGKHNVYDFSLWKAAKPGEPHWQIRLNVEGKEIVLDGRPGWHIEDTAMSYTLFGPQYDLHGGAQELIFPHHTNEIAQAEAAFGKKPFVKYWLHSGVVTVKGSKMSKSLKNFIKIRDFISMYGAEALKMLVLSTHYRKEIDYEERLAISARSRVRYMHSAFSIFYNAQESDGADAEKEINDTIERMKNSFESAMNDDFNTPLAIAALVRAISELRNIASTNRSISKNSKAAAVKNVLYYANILGLLEVTDYKKQLPREAEELIDQRDKLRQTGRFEDADKIREKLKTDFGISIEDTEYGTIWYY
ncbi:MAG: cysteine--tRNA ligase [Candidatus Micrarchaeaceae archaeon]